MILFLYWKDEFNIDYRIAKLELKENEYYLEILEDELKKATRNGCMGIGNVNLLSNLYKSNELFSFFKNRIPSRENPNIDKILKKYGINEYDEMQLLRLTKGICVTDRYRLEEK